MAIRQSAFRLFDFSTFRRFDILFRRLGVSAFRRFPTRLRGLVASWLLFLTACTPTEPNELDKLGKINMTIKGQAFELWIADESDEQLKGLMFVTAQQMAPLPDGTQRGMIFIFDADSTNSFWMRNTIIPLDIAYVSSDRKVVKVHTMAPLDERPNQYPPGTAYRYAIEVNANKFVDLGLRPGDVLELPENVLKRQR